MLSDEDFAADVEQLTLHEPVSRCAECCEINVCLDSMLIVRRSDVLSSSGRHTTASFCAHMLQRARLLCLLSALQVCKCHHVLNFSHSAYFSSPSMASFGSGFNDYVNGLRPPRSSLDGIKLTSVRGPRSSPIADADGRCSAGTPSGRSLVLQPAQGACPRHVSTHACKLSLERRACCA